ncbi:MAG TPA: DUF2723 domain-containing protein [Anaerolineae bacterium]
MDKLSDPWVPVHDNANRIIGAAVFILSAALYLRTVEPTLGGGIDSLEYQHIAYTLGIAHPTGYPLYMVLGKVFTTLFPFGNIAYRMNVLSALLGAGAAVFVFLDIMQLTSRRTVAIAGTAVFVLNVAMWRQSGVASVGPLQMLLLGALVYTLLLWRARRISLAWACLVFGLGLAHHRSILLLAPAIAVYVLLVDFDIIRRPRDLALYGFWLALPLLFYLYLPLRGSSVPWYENTLGGFIGQISAGEAGDYVRSDLFDIVQAIEQLLDYFSDSFGYLGLGLIIVGAIGAIWQRMRRLTHPVPGDSQTLLFLGLSTLVYTGLAVLFGDERDRYFILPFFFLLLWFALGTALLEKQIETRVASQWARRGVHAALLGGLAMLVILPFGDHLRASDWSTNYHDYKQWEEIFTLPIPPGANLVGNWRQLNGMRYMQRIEDRRTDLQLVGTIYDPAPQTRAAQDLVKGDSTLYLAPGLALPQGSYRYALLGPLLQVRTTPEMHPPDYIPVTMNLALSPSLSLIGTGISVALEPYARQNTATLPPGRTARVALFWRAESVMRDWLVRVRLYDPEGRLIAQISEPPVRGLYPPSHWQPGEYVNDVHNFLVPAGLPPGTAQLTMAIVDAETKLQTSNEIALAQLAVDRATDITRDQVFVQHSLDKPLDQRLALWGYGGVDGAHRPGEKMSLYLLWAVRQKISEDTSLYFALSDASGKTWQEWQSTAIAFYPMSRWQPGELLKGYYDLLLSKTLPPGVMTLQVGLSSQTTTPLVKIEIVP